MRGDEAKLGEDVGEKVNSWKVDALDEEYSGIRGRRRGRNGGRG